MKFCIWDKVISLIMSKISFIEQKVSIDVRVLSVNIKRMYIILNLWEESDIRLFQYEKCLFNIFFCIFAVIFYFVIKK